MSVPTRAPSPEDDDDSRAHSKRILLVLAVLQVISAFTNAGSANWATWAGLVAVVIATVLMFLPASNPYFRRTAA